MNVLIMPGHTLSSKGTGAVGYINEGIENRVLGKKIVEYLKLGGCNSTYFQLDKSNNHLVEQVNYANNGNYDLVVQVHFNAYKNTTSAMGCEVYYYDNVKAATQVANKLGSLYKNRGAKCNTNLYWLKYTKASAILIETCFVDSKEDTDIYKANIDKTAKLIAEGILNKPIENPKPSTPTSGEVYYRVVCGSYKDRKNADNMLNELKHKGYSPFIDIYKK